MDLAADEGEAAAELEQGLLQPVHQRLLQVALGRGIGEAQEVEDVRVLGQLLDELGLGGRQLCGEVRRGGRLTLVQSVHDLVEQHVTGPVHAVPLRQREQVIGALNQFNASPGAMAEQDLQLAQALADVATIGILQTRHHQ